jgi:Na+/melibiose symporter-like transporter
MKRLILDRVRKWFLGDVTVSAATEGQFTCGTLHYTPAALAILFGWLLWGDFTMTLMESMPGLLVMQLADYPKIISNTAISMLMVMIGQVFNVMLNPIISYSSDRHRGRWGRRRPFLMFATPFVTLFLILIPWSPEITAALTRVGWVQAVLRLCPIAPLVLTFGFLIVGYTVFNMFIATTYYYLLPDTVPEPFIGRFYGLFRFFGYLAGIIFNVFIYGHAHAHMKLLFAIIGGIYAASFMLLSWKVREGEYPEAKEDRGHWYSPLKNYTGQCFGSVRNWLIFLVYGATQWGGVAGVFSLLFFRDQIGLTETEFGWLGGIALGANMLLSVPFGVLVDRLGGQKSLMIGLLCSVVVGMGCFFGIHDRTTGFILGFLVNVPYFLINAAMWKWMVEMYPRAQYGQYGSAGAIVGAAGAALLSPLVGKLIDVMHNYYRLHLLVPAICNALCLAFCIALFRWPRPETAEDRVPSAAPETTD